MDVIKKIKDFEIKYKSKITYTSSFLLSIGIHAALITIFLILTMFEYKQEKIPQLKNEKRVKVNIRTEQEKKIIKKSQTKKIIVRNQNYKFEEADQNITEETITSLNEKTEYPNEGIKIAYGPEFFMLSKEEQEYIVSQWKRNNQVNELISDFEKEKDLNISEVKITDSNIISFYLYPNGNISDIELLHKEENVFNKKIIKTIEKSAKYYKKPERKTLIKIHVGMGLRE